MLRKCMMCPDRRTIATIVMALYAALTVDFADAQEPASEADKLRAPSVTVAQAGVRQMRSVVAVSGTIQAC